MKSIVKHILMLTLAVLPVVSSQARTNKASKASDKMMVADDLKAVVLFEVNKTAIDAGLGANKAEMDRIASYASNLKNSPSLQVCITAYASPEGRFGPNKKLASDRAANVQKYVSEQLKNNGISLNESQIRVNVVAENWSGLKDYVTVEALPFKEELTAILNDSSLDGDQKKAKIASLDNGKVWKNLVKNVFPSLRTAVVSMFSTYEEDAERKDSAKENFGTDSFGSETAKNAGYAVESGMNVDDASKAAVAENAAIVSALDANVKAACDGQWSVYANAGVSGFHGFRNVEDAKTDHNIAPDVNAGFNYRFNPWFRIGANLRYTKVGTVCNKSNQSTATDPNFMLEGKKTTLTTKTIDVMDVNNAHFFMAGATMDFNLLGFGEKGAGRKAGLWLGTGIGYALGQNHATLSQAVSEQAQVVEPAGVQAFYNHNYIKTDGSDKKTNSLYIPLNLSFSYALTDHVAVELQGNYYIFPLDILTTARGIWAADAGLRYNF